MRSFAQSSFETWPGKGACAWSPSVRLYQESLASPELGDIWRQFSESAASTCLLEALRLSGRQQTLGPPRSDTAAFFFSPMSHLSNHPMGNVRFESEVPQSVGSRLDAWDAARLVATFGIVWTHVCEAQGIDAQIGTLGRFGTSYYILAAALFTVRGHQRAATRKFSEEARRRTKRLLLPFLIWSAIYFAYYFPESLKTGESFESLTMWWGPAAGTALHLWFLPFIYVMGLLGVWVVPKLNKLRPELLFFAGLPFCAFVYWLFYRVIFFAVDRPWLWSWHLHRLDRWIVEIPLYVTAIVLGTAYYRLAPATKRRIESHHWIILAVSLVLFFSIQILYSENLPLIKERTGTDGRFLAHVAGLALLCGSASISTTPLIRFLAPIGRFTYVAFLVHILVLELFRTPMKFLPGYGSVSVALLCNVFIFGLSLGISYLVAKYRLFAWLRP